ncbi:MAG: hypothetical protein WCF33_13610 [Pseudonocardiaceae bacterium]
MTDGAEDAGRRPTRRTARVAASIPHLWGHSPRDQLSHLLAQPGPDQIGILVGVCGHRMLWWVSTNAQPTGRPCPTCEALATSPVPAPRFDDPPHSGRPASNPPRGDAHHAR